MNIHDSIGHIMKQQELLGEKFYEIFFRRCPAAEIYFDGIDMQRQVHVLTMALLVVEQTHSKSYGATKSYLRYMGNRHHRSGIPEQLYPEWLAAMLETLEQLHGTDWNDELAAQWQQSLQSAIELMLEGYETRVVV